MGTEYKVPLHSTLQELASGRPVAPGEVVKLTVKEVEEPHNAFLIENGNLVETQTSTSKGGDK